MEAESAMFLLFSLLVLALTIELIVAISCSISIFNFSLILPGVFAFSIYYHKCKQEILKKSSATKAFDNLQVGHRGCRLPNYVENTLPAILHAIEHGAEAIEIDIRLCKDDVPIVFHDSFLHRLIDMEGRVEDYTYEEIKQMRFRNHPTVGVPRLEEVVDIVKQKKVKLYIESKERRLIGKMAEVLAKLFKEEDLYSEACVISFNPFFLWLLNRADSRIITCFLYKNNLYSGWAKSGIEELSLFLRKTAPYVDFIMTNLGETILPAIVGASIIGPHRNKASASFIEDWQSHGYSIYFWVTNTKEEWLWMRSNRVSISTDFPHLFELTKPTKGDALPTSK